MAPPADSTVSRAVDRMVDAWHRGERPAAEEFFDAMPGIDDDSAIRLVFEEFCLRQEAGIDADPLDFARRFPRWWPDLELLFDCKRLMEASPLPAILPDAGDELAGFLLLAELGRGASGRVFLASQRSLADRPVVVKVTQVGRDEHLSLARLQHMNIMPLHSAQVLEDRHLQILCMPFLGGASLARVLEVIHERDPSEWTGGLLIEALDRLGDDLPVGPSARGPYRRYIARASYVEAICWVGVSLADGLQYAHERDFVHMDVKPSNVLIAGDGQPMLLDFHLAREPIAPGDPAPDHLGGTAGYMAPEQEMALAAVREGRPILAPLDGRADIYSLGLVLIEALGRRRLPAGLSAILRKCTRPDANDRYPDAASLTDDLRRFLDGRPLRGVPNRGMGDRWRRWRRTRPHDLARNVMVLAALMLIIAASSLLFAGYSQRIREIQAVIADAGSRLDRRQFPEASRAFHRGLTLANRWPGVGEYRRELLDGLARSERLAKVDDLHRLAESIRFHHGIEPPSPESSILLHARETWADRLTLASELDESIRADLLDIALLLAGSDNRQAHSLLDETEQCLGPSPTLSRERMIQTGSRDEPLALPEPQSASAHFQLGKSYLRSGDDAKAAEQFRLGLRLRPQDFWLNYYQGLCAYRLGRFEESAASFRVGIALAPESAECFYNRALALGALGRDDEAIDDDSHALDRNPSMGIAWLNRGILRYRRGSLVEAASDLNEALARSTGRKERGMIRYNLSLVDLARGDRALALANLAQAVRDGDEDARSLKQRLDLAD